MASFDQDELGVVASGDTAVTSCRVTVTIQNGAQGAPPRNPARGWVSGSPPPQWSQLSSGPGNLVMPAHGLDRGAPRDPTHLNLLLRVGPTIPGQGPRRASRLLETPRADGISAFSLPTSSEFASAA